MIKATDIITFLKSYSNPTTQFLFDFDFSGLETFIVPETNLYSLVMLSKAREQGLDTVFVDQSKFFDNAMLQIRGDMLNGQGPFEGAWYIEFQLSPVLLRGQTFEFVDYSESMGFGFMLNAMNFRNEIVTYFLLQADKEDSGGCYDEDVQTLEQIADYINKVRSTPKRSKSVLPKIPSWDDVVLSLALIGIALLAGVYYILKAAKRISKWVRTSLTS
jgi:hypothetical protein